MRPVVHVNVLEGATIVFKHTFQKVVAVSPTDEWPGRTDQSDNKAGVSNPDVCKARSELGKVSCASGDRHKLSTYSQHTVLTVLPELGLPHGVLVGFTRKPGTSTWSAHRADQVAYLQN